MPATNTSGEGALTLPNGKLICKWCRFELEACICYTPEWKYARQKLKLTERECSILHEFSQTDGTAKHVARKLNISPKTVEIQVANVKHKLGVATRTMAVLIWHRTIEEFKTMGDMIKPLHPQDIFELHDGRWFYRFELGNHIPPDATLWPHDCPHWHELRRQQEAKARV